MNGFFRLTSVAFFMLAIVSVSGKDIDTKKKGPAMQVTKDLVMPYQLKVTDLPSVEVVCQIESPKGEFGAEMIRISGATGVTLSHTDIKSGKASELHGKTDPHALVTLLRLFEEAGFMEVEEENHGESGGPKRTLALVMPGRKKKTEIVGMEHSESNRLIGAIKLTAGMGVPEALQKKFLNHL